MILFLVACSTADEEVLSITGTVTAETGESAAMVSATAFGVKVGDTAGLFVSPNPDSTCADAASFLSSNDPDFNAEIVSGEGVCNLYVRVEDYDGATVSLDEASSATVSLNCAMDTGAWEEEDRSDEGFYYTGPYWVGSPEAYTLGLSGGADDSDFTLSIDMDTYNGRFPYDAVEPEADPASGTVSGSVVATWCDDLAPAF